MLLVTNFFRMIFLAFPTAPVMITIIAIAAVVTFVAISKSQKVQERSFVRKVKKVKEKQKAYKNEKDNNKLEARVKDYDKALKKLKKRISYALWWNKKKIVLTNPILVNETAESNLSLNGTPFTFKDVLNEMISNKTKNEKKRTQVIEKNKTVKQLNAKNQQKALKPVALKLQEPVKKIEAVKIDDDNLASIYKTNVEEKTK